MALLISLFSKAYFITPESFKQQFAGINVSQYINAAVVMHFGPLPLPISYKRNPIRQIKCTDKNNEPVVLQNNSTVEIKFTYVSEKLQRKRTSFFFDTLVVTDKTITGGQSRYMPFIKRTIPLDTVTEIEVRSLRKNM